MIPYINHHRSTVLSFLRSSISLIVDSQFKTMEGMSIPPTLGGSSHDLYVVNNHGDRKSPRPGVVGPLQNRSFMAYKQGLLTT